ncbi:hypothetical protein INR49_028435 [Caranx melampygus]|nr:hypothetical protein INR49_028435 [Caranx melampygus]
MDKRLFTLDSFCRDSCSMACSVDSCLWCINTTDCFCSASSRETRNSSFSFSKRSEEWMEQTAQGELRHALLPEQPMIQPQAEAWVLESPPPAMESQYSRTSSGPGGRTTSTHATSQTALTTSEAGLKKPLHYNKLHHYKQKGTLGFTPEHTSPEKVYKTNKCMNLLQDNSECFKFAVTGSKKSPEPLDGLVLPLTLGHICWYHIWRSMTLLCIIRPEEHQIDNLTAHDGYRREGWLPSRGRVPPPFPTTPLTMKSSRAKGVDCLSPRPGQETGALEVLHSSLPTVPCLCLADRVAGLGFLFVLSTLGRAVMISWCGLARVGVTFGNEHITLWCSIHRGTFTEATLQHVDVRGAVGFSVTQVGNTTVGVSGDKSPSTELPHTVEGQQVKLGDFSQHTTGQGCPLYSHTNEPVLKNDTAKSFHSKKLVSLVYAQPEKASGGPVPSSEKHSHVQADGADEGCVTFVLHDEDHTLGNSLRYMIMKQQTRSLVPLYGISNMSNASASGTASSTAISQIRVTSTAFHRGIPIPFTLLHDVEQIISSCRLQLHIHATEKCNHSKAVVGFSLVELRVLLPDIDWCREDKRLRKPSPEKK